MAKSQRYISTSFWTDKWIRSLDPSERYVYMYLLTNPETNIAGMYQITLDRIAFDTGYDERTLRPMFDRFAKAKKAYFVADEYIILPHWPNHQKWQVKKTIKVGIDSVINDTPKQVKDYAFSIGYQYPMTGYAYDPSYFDSDLDIDFDSNSNKSGDPSDAPSDVAKKLPDEAIRLATLLATLHTELVDAKRRIDPKAIDKWAGDIDKLNRIDGRPWPDIEKAIRWAKAMKPGPNGFTWAVNIVSGAKLREKFDTIWPQCAKAPSMGQQGDEAKRKADMLSAMVYKGEIK
jgi:hypothetical protein